MRMCTDLVEKFAFEKGWSRGCDGAAPAHPTCHQLTGAVGRGTVPAGQDKHPGQDKQPRTGRATPLGAAAPELPTRLPRESTRVCAVINLLQLARSDHLSTQVRYFSCTLGAAGGGCTGCGKNRGKEALTEPRTHEGCALFP